jgi:hypothetical protein
VFFLRFLSRALMVFPIGTLLYDLVYQWFVKDTFDIRSLKEWGEWLDKDSYAQAAAAIKDVFPQWDAFAQWPAPATLLIPPVFFYVLYRIWFAARGGSGGKYRYKFKG